MVEDAPRFVVIHAAGGFASRLPVFDPRMAPKLAYVACFPAVSGSCLLQCSCDLVHEAQDHIADGMAVHVGEAERPLGPVQRDGLDVGDDRGGAVTPHI